MAVSRTGVQRPYLAVLFCLQVGWVTGPARLVAAIAKAHQFVTFCIPSNLQRAVAFGLQHEQPFYKQVYPQLRCCQRRCFRSTFTPQWQGLAPMIHGLT
jgi:aspartate/methionine/tyrosine aminotransferase